MSGTQSLESEADAIHWPGDGAKLRNQKCRE